MTNFAHSKEIETKEEIDEWKAKQQKKERKFSIKKVTKGMKKKGSKIFPEGEDENSNSSSKKDKKDKKKER